MAKYLILIYGDDQKWSEAGEAAMREAMVAHNRFAEQVTELGGTILGGDALEPGATGTTIRDGIVTDGPFIDTKESLGGYYVIEANDLDHAIAIAKLCPAMYGGVEVRPVMIFD